MKKACAALAIPLIVGTVLAGPARADSYPVSGKWGVSTSAEKGPIDCGKLRILSFNGNQRTDTGGGVPAFRNRSVAPLGGGSYRVQDVFTTGQIANAHVDYTLLQIDSDHLDLNMDKGGLLKLRKCK